MSDIEMDRHVAKAHEQVATRNARAAVQLVGELEHSMVDRMNALEAIVVNQQGELKQLQHKYNLLLTKNFNGGSTS